LSGLALRPLLGIKQTFAPLPANHFREFSPEEGEWNQEKTTWFLLADAGFTGRKRQFMPANKNL
jgi:hypothetical protein